MIGSDGEGKRKEAIRVKDVRTRHTKNGSIGFARKPGTDEG